MNNYRKCTEEFMKEMEFVIDKGISNNNFINNNEKKSFLNHLQKIVCDQNMLHIKIILMKLLILIKKIFRKRKC